MAAHSINITEKFNLFSDHWSPKVIAEMNDYQFKLAKVEGEFVWHSHNDTDETFIVIDGELTIEFRDRHVVLKKGEMVVVPRGVEHKPSAENECKIMLLEPKAVVNTGDSGGELTAENDVWISTLKVRRIRGFLPRTDLLMWNSLLYYQHHLQRSFLL